MRWYTNKQKALGILAWHKHRYLHTSSKLQSNVCGAHLCMWGTQPNQDRNHRTLHFRRCSRVVLVVRKFRFQTCLVAIFINESIFHLEQGAYTTSVPVYFRSSRLKMTRGPPPQDDHHSKRRVKSSGRTSIVLHSKPKISISSLYRFCCRHHELYFVSSHM